MDIMDDSSLPKSRFWGLVVQPGKRYEQTARNDFHISMATLDLSKAKDKTHSQVSVEVDGESFIICNLMRNGSVQQPLDLLFDVGDTLAFSVNGDAAQPVHLTGYYTMNEDPDEMDDIMAEDEEEESGEEDESSAPSLVPIKNGTAKTTKPLKGSGDNGDVNGVAQKGGVKRKQDISPEKTAKVSKLSSLVDNSAEEAEEESEDEDYECAEEGEDDSDDEGEEEVEEGFSDDDEEDNEDDSDENMEDADDSDDEDEQDELPDKGKLKSNADKDTTKEVATPKEANKKKKGATPGAAPSEKTNGVPKGVKKTINGGVMLEDLVVGNGSVAKSGRPVTVYYRGVLKQNNKQFDATTSGPGFKFRLGAGDVIKGWDRGVEGMRVGGKRRITCPPNMAYGKRGSPPVIPPNSTLVFEVTLKNVQ